MKTRFYYSTPQRIHHVLLTEDMNIKKQGKSEFLPRITICGLISDDYRSISFGVSVCSSEDVFRKTIGRELSEKRAKDTPLMKVAITKTKGITELFMKTTQYLENQIREMKHLRLNGIDERTSI